MKKELERTQKRFLIIMGTFIAFCIMFLIPFIQNFIISVLEKILLQRKANHPEKIKLYMTFLGLGGVFYFLILSVIAYFKLEKRIEISFSKNSKAIAIVIIIVYTIFSVFLDFISNDIWFDEAFTVSLCTHSFTDVISLTAKDVHPPLYYLLLKIFTICFGNSIFVQRIFSTLPIIIFMVAGFVFLSKEFSARTAAFFELFVFASGTLLSYSHEIRMYSWAALFCGMCAIYSYYILSRNKITDWIFYVIFAVCSAYTQYFAAVLILCNFLPICIYKFIKCPQSRKIILASCGLGFLLYSPWIPVVIKQFTQVSNSYWISPVSFMRVIECLKVLSPANGFFAYFGLLYMGLLLSIFLIKKEKNFWQILCTFSPLLQIFLGLLISIIVRPIFIERYAVPGIFFICISGSLIISKMNDAKLSLANLFVLAVFASISSISNFKTEKHNARNYNDFILEVAPKITAETQFLIVENSQNSFSGHQRGILGALFPHHKIYTKNKADDWWAYTFNSEFLPIENAPADLPICVLTEDSTPDLNDTEIVANILKNDNWQNEDYILVSPSSYHYKKYKVYFFENNK